MNDKMSGEARGVVGDGSPTGAEFGRVKRWFLLRLLDQYAKALEVQGKQQPADAVLDLMDGVAGWCHPDWRLDD